MAEFKDMFVIFAVAGLFIFSMIAFGVNMQTDNDVDVTLLEDSTINRTYNSLNSSLNIFGDEANASLSAFESEAPKTGFGSLILETIVSGGTKFTGMVTGVYNIIVVMPAQLLGISQIVFSVINAIILVLIIIGLWRLYKLGG